MTVGLGTRRISRVEMMKSPSCKPKALIGCRHVQILLATLGFLCCYAVRVTMSVALVAMTDPKSANPDYEGFQWDETTRGYILSSFFWGYVLTQIPGGIVAQRWGPCRLYGLSVGICGLASLFGPLAAHYGGWKGLVFCRIVAGLCQGAVLPTIHTLLSKWVPQEERGRLSAFLYSGGWIGNVISLLSSGVLAASDYGWPSCFYVWGGLTVLWSIVWCFLGKDSPADHPSIPHDEKEYIEISLGTVLEVGQVPSTPWRHMLTSSPFWALLVTQCAQTWGFWMLLTETPLYMNAILGFNIQENGYMSSLPYLTAWILSFPFSFLSDLLIKKRVIGTGMSRKIFNSIGQYIPAIALIGLGYVRADRPTLAVTILVLAVGSNIAVYCGHHVNHMDLSPNFAGTMMGVINAVANVWAIAAPLIVSEIVKESGNILQWRIVFFLSSGIYVVGNTIFLLFGTAKVQKWNDPSPKDEIVLESARQTILSQPDLNHSLPLKSETTELHNCSQDECSADDRH
ncbi:putative inorganic phosphate cotransporter [Orussus abietinus]|uniref:putative inorganic phosphate cotransporter n=1 Tax=Orussus abietinus TaxID=222816 RepID=UPI0006269A41|nr:putative inorganic phosphate cotransporter [Orussus abietinus]